MGLCFLGGVLGASDELLRSDTSCLTGAAARVVRCSMCAPDGQNGGLGARGRQRATRGDRPMNAASIRLMYHPTQHSQESRM
jgi:hypothetical protein